MHYGCSPNARCAPLVTTHAPPLLSFSHAVARPLVRFDFLASAIYHVYFFFEKIKLLFSCPPSCPAMQTTNGGVMVCHVCSIAMPCFAVICMIDNEKIKMKTPKLNRQ